VGVLLTARTRWRHWWNVPCSRCWQYVSQLSSATSACSRQWPGYARVLGPIRRISS